MIFNHSKFTINPPLKKRYFGLVFGGHYTLSNKHIQSKANTHSRRLQQFIQAFFGKMREKVNVTVSHKKCLSILYNY